MCNCCCLKLAEFNKLGFRTIVLSALTVPVESTRLLPTVLLNGFSLGQPGQHCSMKWHCIQASIYPFTAAIANFIAG